MFAVVLAQSGNIQNNEFSNLSAHSKRFNKKHVITNKCNFTVGNSNRLLPKIIIEQVLL